MKTMATIQILSGLLFIIVSVLILLAPRKPPVTPAGYNVCFGHNAGANLTTQNGCVLIGDNVSDPTRDNQLRIRFEGGTEYVRQLPPGKVVDLRMFNRGQRAWLQGLPPTGNYIAIGKDAEHTTGEGTVFGKEAGPKPPKEKP